MVARLSTGLNVAPGKDLRNMIGRLQRAITRNYGQRERARQRGNISSRERIRVLYEIEAKATALSGCFPIDRITRSEIVAGLAEIGHKSRPLNEAEQQASEFINSIKANLVRLSKVTKSMAKKLSAGEAEAIHFRLSLLREIEPIWKEASCGAPLRRSRKPIDGDGTFSPIQFVQAVIGIIDPGFGEESATALLQMLEAQRAIPG